LTAGFGSDTSSVRGWRARGRGLHLECRQADVVVDSNFEFSNHVAFGSIQGRVTGRCVCDSRRPFSGRPCRRRVATRRRPGCRRFGRRSSRPARSLLQGHGQLPLYAAIESAMIAFLISASVFGAFSFVGPSAAERKSRDNRKDQSNAAVFHLLKSTSCPSSCHPSWPAPSSLL
jgi:hypothetical protein